MTIAIDFDGTCVTHDYPHVGESIGAQEVLLELVNAGHDLILYTMRSGLDLHYAEQWFSANNIPLAGVQFNPSQSSWTASNKCYAHVYIDDAALGCPLIHDRHKKPYVDWVEVKRLLIEKKIL